MSQHVKLDAPGESVSAELSDAPAAGKAQVSLPWVGTWIILLSVSAVVSCVLVMVTHGAGGFFVPVLATAVCILAALFDAWTARIPNQLTYMAVGLGLAINLAASEWAGVQMPTIMRWLAAPGFTESSLGFSICGLVAVVGILCGIGGGDLKLIVALGALLGLTQLGYVVVAGLCVAVVYSLFNLLILGRLNTFASMFALRLLELFYLRKLHTFDREDKPLPAHQVPMGIPLAIGLILSQVIDLRIGGA